MINYYMYEEKKEMTTNCQVSLTLCKKACPYFYRTKNTNKMNSLHHMKEYPKISSFLQFESHSSKCKIKRFVWK